MCNWNRNNNNVAGNRNRRVNDCEDVFECLLELLEDALEENNHNNNNNNGRVRDCEDVFECLEELLEDVLGENNNNHHCRKY